MVVAKPAVGWGWVARGATNKGAGRSSKEGCSLSGNSPPNPPPPPPANDCELRLDGIPISSSSLLSLLLDSVSDAEENLSLLLGLLSLLLGLLSLLLGLLSLLLDLLSLLRDLLDRSVDFVLDRPFRLDFSFCVVVVEDGA